MNRFPLFFLSLAFITILISIGTAAPPGVVKRDAPDSVFSAERARIHLQQIARAPHSIGTAEHALVRGYILEAFRQIGLSPEIQQTTVVEKFGETLAAANVSNIVVRVRGTRPGKAILMSAHYDSQPNTPGAGDDGMGVSALLETARALKHLPPLKNDIIYLVSDGEEEGLFGAKAFVTEYPDLKDVEVVINWDFRGNTGIVVAYETSAENGWMIRQYAKGAVYPSASSMAYEVSKRMPNDADFTPFKKTGVTGFANGALGGFVNYHSMTDRPERLDLRTMQQAGSNMLGLLKQTGNTSLADTKAPDLSYFNIAGFLFIYYPVQWNLFFAIGASLFLGIALIKGFAQKQIKAAGFVTAFFALPVVCALAYFASSFALKAILGLYPLYSHFYENNSYNSSWYFVAMTMLALLIFYLVYRPLFRKWGYRTIQSGILLNIAFLMWLSWMYIPSAAFLFTIPCLFLSAGFLIKALLRDRLPSHSFGDNFMNFISVLPGLLLFAPVCDLLYTTFGLGGSMPFVPVMIVLATALLFPVLQPLFNSRPFIIPGVILAVLVVSSGIAHLKGGFDKTHPLHTNVRYRLDADDQTAQWLSDFPVTDQFSQRFFPDRKIDTSYKYAARLIHAAPVLPYSAPGLYLLKDSTYEGTRELTLRGLPSRTGVNMMGLIFDDSNIYSRILLNGKTAIDGKSPAESQAVKFMTLYGAGKEGFEITLVMKATEKPGMTIFDRSMGLPEIKNLTDYPEDIIPGTDFNCNTVLVKKHFSF